jgi:hypothetical protein
MPLSYRDPIAEQGPRELKGIRINFPDVAFDALNASDEALGVHFLPPRPDARRAPVAFANWVRAMASRPVFPPQPLDPEATAEHILIRTHANGRVTQESSGNWSGGYVRPRSFESMALVQGRWIVPDTPVFDPAKPGFVSSVWVGLDGHDPASRVIPQIGTGQIAHLYPRPNAPSIPDDRQLAWWQLWLRDNQHRWQIEIPMEIKRKDRIYAQVHAISSTIVSFYLKNETTNSAYAAHYYLLDDMADPYVTPVERRTADWILERPLIPDRLGPGAKPISVPLADYGETAFTDCNAATVAENGTLREFQLQRAQLIRMNLWDDPTRPGRLASLPERVGDDVIHMSYVKAP